MILHPRPDMPGEAVAQYPIVAVCERCGFRLAATDVHDAEKIEKGHPCPSEEGFMSTIHETAWAMLDGKVAEVYDARAKANEQGMDGDPGFAEQYAREAEIFAAEALGLARMLALLLFREVSWVREEAARRYAARTAGETYVTPGVGSQRVPA